MFEMLQNPKITGSWGRVVAGGRFLRGNEPFCPECLASWRSLVELQRSGGVIRSLGRKLEAICPGCGYSWSVNKFWRTVQVINGIHK